MAVYHSQTDTKPINEMFPAIWMTDPQLDVWISMLIHRGFDFTKGLVAISQEVQGIPRFFSG